MSHATSISAGRKYSMIFDKVWCAMWQMLEEEIVTRRPDETSECNISSVTHDPHWLNSSFRVSRHEVHCVPTSISALRCRVHWWNQTGAITTSLTAYYECIFLKHNVLYRHDFNQVKCQTLFLQVEKQESVSAWTSYCVHLFIVIFLLKKHT